LNRQSFLGEDMKAGFGRRCINPPIGSRLDGWGDPEGKRLAEGINDDLYARAVYIEHEGEEALIIAHDLLFFARQYADSIKGAIGRATGLPPWRILLNVSHTHAGPVVGEWSYQALMPPQMSYIKQVIAATVEAAEEAMRKAVRCRLYAGAGQTRLPVSRRKPDGKGRVTWAVYPEGSICPLLPVLHFKNDSGRSVALIYSVSCHTSNIGGSKVSADYSGAACKRLDEYLGPPCSLFLQGAGGDTKACVVADSPNGQWRSGTPADIEKAGEMLFAEIRPVLDAGLSEISPRLHCHAYETRWPLQRLPSRQQMEEKAKEAVSGPYYRELLARLDRDGKLPDAACLTAQGIQFGKGVRLLAVEGELVADLGKLMISEYGGGLTLPLGYSNGTGLYLPTSTQIDEGGYEADSFIEYYFAAPLAKGTENIIRSIVAEMKRHGIN
jgi:hypothetical protein